MITHPSPPSYPLRPVNGGPLEKAQPKHGHWAYEPKLNGWRAWVHPATGRMFNRKNEPLSITAEFSHVLDRLQKIPALRNAWLDCEAMSRRVPVGKGSLVVLDILGMWDMTHEQRMRDLYGLLVEPGHAQAWGFEQFRMPDQEILLFSYAYEDAQTQIATGAVVKGSGDKQTGGVDPDLLPTAGWKRLQEVNRALGCELFEGLVAKRVDSLYPLQLRSPSIEFPFWMKHRWAF